MKQKKGQMGVNIGQIIGGVIGLIFLVVVGFVSVALLLDSNLLTSNSAFYNASNRMVNNLTSGVDVVSSKIVTIFTIAVAVLILGLIVFLAVRARQIQSTQGQSL
jgi:uncharacterized membrane protein